MKEKQIFKILVIDDNSEIYQDFSKILSSIKEHSSSRLNGFQDKLDNYSPKKEKKINFEYKLTYASQGNVALNIVKESILKDEPFALAFVDVVMPPGWDGVETIKHLWEVDPDLQIAICTAYSEYSWEDIIEELGISDSLLILKKPFDPIEVRQIACCLTQKWNLNRQVGHQFDRLHQKIAQNSEAIQDLLNP